MNVHRKISLIPRNVLSLVRREKAYKTNSTGSNTDVMKIGTDRRQISKIRSGNKLLMVPTTNRTNMLTGIHISCYIHTACFL